MVPQEYVGVAFRQLAYLLKIYKDGRPSERRISARPLTDPVSGPSTANPYLDADEPTLVTFEADDAVDVAGLLATGAIVPVESDPEITEAPKPAARAKEPAARASGETPPAEGG